MVLVVMEKMPIMIKSKLIVMMVASVRQLFIGSGILSYLNISFVLFIYLFVLLLQFPMENCCCKQVSLIKHYHFYYFLIYSHYCNSFNSCFFIALLKFPSFSIFIQCFFLLSFFSLDSPSFLSFSPFCPHPGHLIFGAMVLLLVYNYCSQKSLMTLWLLVTDDGNLSTEVKKPSMNHICR